MVGVAHPLPRPFLTLSSMQGQMLVLEILCWTVRSNRKHVNGGWPALLGCKLKSGCCGDKPSSASKKKKNDRDDTNITALRNNFM